MKVFMVNVTKCSECPKFRNGSFYGYCVDADEMFRYWAVTENKDGLTTSCPMWNKSVEIPDCKEVNGNSPCLEMMG